MFKLSLKELFSREWTVTGIVSNAQTGAPVPNLTVKAFDYDYLLRDEDLGKDTTDESGRYTIKFHWRDFFKLLEFRPDVYIKVFDAEGRLLKDTRPDVVRNGNPYQEIHAEVQVDQPQPITHVGGLEVNREVFEQTDTTTLLNVARIIKGQQIDNKTAETLASISPQLTVDGIINKEFCFTPTLRFLNDALRLKKADRNIYTELDRILSVHYFGYSTHVYNTPNFSITYVLNDGGTTSSDAVANVDTAENIVLPGTTTVVGSTVAGNGVPNYVEKVGFWLEYALNVYINPPYALKNPASSGRITVTVAAGGAGGATPSGFFINNALNDDLIAAVSCHELFHMVQYEYGVHTAFDIWTDGMTEGGAVMAEDIIFDTHNRYIVQASDGTGTLDNPQVSLHASSMQYRLALFLKYISEQHSFRIGAGHEPDIGVETYTRLIEQCELDGFNSTALRRAIANLPFYQSFYDISYLDPARLDTDNNETTLGNFYLALYLKDFGVNIPDKRFDFKEDEENTTWDTLFLGSNVVDRMGSVDITRDNSLPDGGTITISGTVNTFAARYYIIRPVTAVTTLRVDFSTSGGFSKPIFQIVQVNADGSVRDIHRTDKTSYQKTIANLQAGQNLDRLVLIVTGTDTGGDFSLNISEVSNAPDVMITRWNSAVGKEYQVDSFNYAWTWGSPDVWVDNDDNGVADSAVYFNHNNHLYVRLRNKGLVDANNVQVEFWYQDAASGLNDADWLPVRNTGGSVQSLTGVTVGAGGTYQGFVNWSPTPVGTSNHFCVRVVVSAPGDPNTDNKRCTNNFGNVIMGSPYADLLIRLANRANFPVRAERVIVPRLTGNFVISEMDAKLGKQVQLQEGEERIDALRIIQSRVNTIRETNDDFTAGDCYKGESAKLRPDLKGFYPANPDILPPGVEQLPMVTIAHVVDGRLVGGYTYVLHGEGPAG